MKTTQSVVLCIDDYAPGLEVRTLLLKKWGYSVITAANGEEALGVLKGCTVDAVVVDYVMPGMNGGEIAQAVKSRWPCIPIIMFSGHPRIPMSAKTYIDGFVCKGSSGELLRSMLSTLLGTERLSVRTTRRMKEILGKSIRTCRLPFKKHRVRD